MPLWELLERGAVWLEMYRTVAIAERKADAGIRKREQRRARMKQMMSGGRGR